MKRIIILTVAAILSLSLTITPALACTTVVVGKDLTDTGNVLFAHSEELGDSPTHYKSVPRKYYSGSDKWIGISNGTVLTQPAMTYAYMASTIYDKDYYPGDLTSGVNENQVTIGNNMSWTRDVPSSTAWDLKDGGIIWTEYTQLVLERAKTAEEGIDIISSLHETHKLSGDPGTMYAIADPNEAWIIELAIDGQWIAKKINDDEIYTLPNAFTIGVEDLEHDPSIKCSSDLVSYAEGKSWYSTSDGAFSFKDVYGLPSRQSDDYNLLRIKMADRILSPGTVTKKKLMEFMRSAYEGTEYYKEDPKTGSPFNTGTRVISTMNTEVNAVVELRDNLPKEIGTTVWWALATSKTSPYIPYYFGATYFPDEYATTSLDENDGSAYWAYRKLSYLADKNYSKVFKSIKQTWDEFEDVQFKEQTEKENKALALMASHSTAAGISYLNNYSNERASLAYTTSLDLTKALKQQLEQPAKLLAPTNLSVYKKSHNSVSLMWTASPNATSYDIYRSDKKNGAYKVIANVSKLNYDDKNLTSGKKYYYKVVAKAMIDGKLVSSEDSVIKDVITPLKKTTVKLKKSGKKNVAVSWKKISNATGYQIYKATKKNGKYSKVKTIKKSKTTKWTDKKNKKGKTYYYKVRAYKTVDGKKVYGAYSSVKKIKIKR